LIFAIIYIDYEKDKDIWILARRGCPL
jgi:hypothetical protein